ncbi:S41 family peptidase [Pyxidicoccus xibeiensis]|uniref:S41 family peptidase n=1 Tax=Pyxidicoccus xibeiensis TaxID=2906759 RepID=UPI0020A7FED3|nr:S41 family peptidase [Pyxidicoccus xibeiensis]MCP3139485.1 S41 family peptidase [Pyxidicoccus xibeiensis]
MRIASFICLVFVSTLCGCGERAVPPSPANDLRGVVRFLEEAHPQPHAYVEPSALTAVVDAEAARLEALQAPSDLELGLSFHRVLSRLGDGHLALALPLFQPEAGPLSLLPLLPKRVGGTLYVDASTPTLPRGSVLLSIDGVDAEEVWSTLSELVLVDANHPTARRAALERGFARHFHLAYGMRERYVARVRLPDGETRDVTLDGVERDSLATLTRYSAPLWGPQPEDHSQPAWPWLVRLNPSTVLLRMPSFGIADQAEYARRVDALFAQLAGSDTLVLDLRGNEGGLRTHGIAVLNHVLGQPYAQWTRMAVRTRNIPEAHRARVSFPFVPEEALSSRFARARQEDGRFVLDGDPLASMMQPRGEGYPGPVVAFIDGATKSAAVELVAALRAFRPDALLIGEESGGECGRHIGEMPVAYTTPARSVTVLVSLIELTHVPTRGCEPGHGFRPDRAIVYDERAFLQGRDPYVDAL